MLGKHSYRSSNKGLELSQALERNKQLLQKIELEKVKKL